MSNQKATSPEVLLKNVSKAFKTAHQPVEVLSNIDLDIKQGEFLVIFGPSGCGKSTLLHIILGLEPPDVGSQVSVLGSSLFQKRDNGQFALDEDYTAQLRKSSIGMVYQQTYWVKSLNVLQNVAFPLLLLGEAKEQATKRALEVLRSLHMQDWADYVPTELSSGQQQRVNLARALVINPQLIIADEPTGNLDYHSGKELMEMLVELNKVGKTVIMVTHDLEYLPYATRAVEMLDGKIVKVYDDISKQEILEDLKTKKIEPNQERIKKKLDKPIYNNQEKPTVKK